MTAQRVLTSVFPKPRRPLTVVAALPLAVFLVTFLLGCFLLELCDVVLFARPSAFVLVLAAPWVWWMHFAGGSGLSRVRGLAALTVRFLVLAALVMALADPRAVRRSDALAVMFALDLSDSMGDEGSEAALSYVVRTASGKPEKDAAGLVVFGRQAMVELPPRVSFPFEAINSRVSRDGTSVEKGLSLAAAMLPDSCQGRIVLVSDGVSTEGNLSAVLDDLDARSIPVDVLPVGYQHEHEVWLEKLELPRTVKAGETYEAAVVLSALSDGRGTLALTENGKRIAEEDVSFRAGKNRYVLPLYLRRPGFYEYVATIDVPPGRDGWEKNNVAVSHIFLKGKGNILVVTDPAGRAEDWQHLVDALERAERLVERKPPFEFPRDAFALMPYDGIVFVNVPADAFDAVQLQAVHDAVYHQGTGFLMVGGRNSYGPGGYHRTPVEKALPVTMDTTHKKVLPKGALVIILHTCEFAQGNTWGKRIAKQAISVLGGQDEAGVLAYTHRGEGWIFKLTPASEYERLVPLINQAALGDMPSFEPTMRMGIMALEASDAAMKHMIIISDGDPSPPTPGLIGRFQKAGVSISTIIINPHGGAQDPSIRVMKSIASSTGGRFYHPKNAQRLPSIFVKEAKTLKRSMIQNKDFVPEIGFPSSVLKGIDPLPPLHGLVLSMPKSRATTILRVPEVEDVDPVLATWRYGVGKTAAWTSDLTTNWGADWLRSPHYRPFVKQLITDIARASTKSSLRLHTYAEAATGILVVEDFHRDAAFLEVGAQVLGPQGKSVTVELEQVGPQRYWGEFPLWGNGHYHVTAYGAGGGRNERAPGRFVVPYSPEYLRFRSDPITLRRIVERTGGRMLAGDEKSEDIFLKEREPRSSSASIVDWFLLALACLIPLDVGVRRIQIDWLLVRSWLGLGRKRGPSGATLGALLERKKSIEFPEHERPVAPARPALQPRPAQPRPVAKPPTPEPEPPTKTEEPESEPTSTTGRLLARKRRWKK